MVVGSMSKTSFGSSHEVE
ncbi:hypothetical protein QN277_005771 [Acacia crassicarpa]|uniref:Uncharacterized protein n=1 Tax=Acacia crassicarpa TaxID=499986 RepID=A0AAE1IYW2_9FABA|nr:hypothetical protein QN277_005771 [Acacia crassicarpa]